MYRYNNVIVAGINTEDEFAKWLQDGKPETNYYFERRLDHFDMGSVIYLGMDWSEVHYGLSKTPRVDMPEYYEEKERISEDEIIDVENNESVE